MKNSENHTPIDLIKRYRSGSEADFEELVHRFEPMFASVALTLSLDVGEVYSDACLSLRRAADTYDLDGEVTFGLYAKICVTRAMLDYLKRSKRDVDFSNLGDDDVAVSDGVQRRLEREESLKAVFQRARELLSELEYDVFRLSMRGYSVDEVAEKLGCAFKSAENAKARMRKKLREGFGQIPEI